MEKVEKKKTVEKADLIFTLATLIEMKAFYALQ